MSFSSLSVPFLSLSVTLKNKKYQDEKQREKRLVDKQQCSIADNWLNFIKINNHDPRVLFCICTWIVYIERLLPWPANENHVLVQNVHDFRKCSRVSYMGRLSARFECSHRRGISLFRGILHAVGEGINNEWRRCCAYAYDDYRVLQWKSLAKCSCNGKHRIRFNEAADARSKTRSRANEYFLNPFSRFVVEFSADGLNHFFLSFFYKFHSKV